MVGVVSERIEVQIVAVSHSDELLSSQSTIQHCQSSHSPASPLYEIVGPVGLEARFFMDSNAQLTILSNIFN